MAHWLGMIDLVRLDWHLVQYLGDKVNGDAYPDFVRLKRE
jgi:hypothetical protein